MKRSAMTRSRRNTGPNQKTRDSVFERDGSHCCLCGGSYLLQIHHRAPRKAGGTSRPEINGQANLLVLCSDCHSWVESNRETARDRGYLVGFGQTPAEVPLIWNGCHVLLSDDGSVTPVEGAA